MSVFPDQVRQFGGAPVGSGYGWKLGSTSWFVDGDVSVTGDGKSLTRPFKTIYEAVNNADAWDVIYIAPKAWTSGNLWLGTAYQETTDLSLTYAKTGVAVVGLGHQGIIGQPYGTVIQEKSASANPIWKIHAPMVAFENLSFENQSTAVNGLYFYGDVAGTSEAALGSVYNCHFHGLAGAGASGDTGGAAYFDACWGATVDRCSFLGCRIGISFKSDAGTAGNFIARNNTFMSRLLSASDVSADIYVYTQGSVSLAIYKNVFAHLIPSYSGGHARWVLVTADVRQGIVADNYCGGVTGTNYTVGPTGTGIVCPANVGHGGNYGNAAILASTTP